MERLTERDPNGIIHFVVNRGGISPEEKLAEYEDLEEAGLLIRLKPDESFVKCAD